MSLRHYGNSEAVKSRTYQSEDGLSLHFDAYGEGVGTPVLCLHGLSRNARDFEELAHHIATERKVYCADFRGRGKSEWDPNPEHYNPEIYVRDIQRLFQVLDLQRVILIGTSLGGIVSAGLCHVLGSRIAGVVLNDIGPVIDQEGLIRIGSHVGKGTRWDSWNDAVREISEINKVVYPDFGEDAWMAFAHQTCRENPDGSVEQDYDPAIAAGFAAEQAASTDLWSLFDVFKTVPVLVVRGALSDLLSEDTVASMINRYPDCKAVTVANRGHVPTLTETESLEAIETFIARVDSAENGQL